jgi:hypothetical protein
MKAGFGCIAGVEGGRTKKGMGACDERDIIRHGASPFCIATMLFYATPCWNALCHTCIGRKSASPDLKNKTAPLNP